jgi:hypothetical protein
LGSESYFIKEKLIVGMLISRMEFLESAKKALIGEFGPLDYEKGPISFDYTHYYDKEMDTPIERCFFSFKELVDPSRLADIKIFTNGLEEKYAIEGQRKINLDPGLMALSRFVLATTKDNAHRIALKRGIYAEVTLLYRKKNFEVLEWTYPDYRSRENRDILKEIRVLYKEDLKKKAEKG